MLTKKIFGCVLLLMSLLVYVSSNGQIDIRIDHPVAAVVLPNTTVAIDPQKGYLLTEISNKVYYVTDGVYQMMFMVTGSGIVVVDAPPSIGGNILKAIREVSDEPITHVIYSHCHPDHIGAADIYPVNAIYVSGEKAAEELKKHNTASGMVAFGAFTGGKPVRAPTKTFKDSMTIIVGDKIIKLLHINQPAHSTDDIIVYLPKEKIAMMVDIVFPGWIPFEQVAYAMDIDGYQQLQQYLLGLDFNTLVAGHWSKLGTRQDVINNMEYVNDLLVGLEEGFQKTDIKPLAAKVGTQNIDLLMEAYLDAVAHYATNKVQNKWKDKLSGCDVWTYSHARKLLPFVRDSGVIIKSSL